MKKFKQKNIKTLFSNLCCSKCKNDFTADSLTIKRQEGKIYICNLVCNFCGKDFGDIIFKSDEQSDKISPMEIIDGPPPITSDDVIEAHRFIKKMK